jgi:uncharacterized protein YbjT (DUF2867 family)
MRVVLFGATGMLGHGVLRECLRDESVEAVLAIGRGQSALTHAKLRQIVERDLFRLEELGTALDGYDVCLYCLGMTSVGMLEADYRRLTVELTVSIAATLFKHNAGMNFLFISGTGTDSSGTSATMWARVKGEAENALLGMGFAAAYMFRPAFVQPMDGCLARTGWMRVLAPLVPVLRMVSAGYFSTTEELGRAMLRVASHGYSKRILDSSDFRAATLADGVPASP